MGDSPQSDGGTAETAETPADPSTRGRRRTLDGRTIAICVTLGVIAALATLLVGSFFTSSGDDADPAMVLKDPKDADTLLSQPLETTSGDPTDLTRFEKGQPMLVNLWQSTCAPCINEMPLLNDAQADNPDVTFVGIATQDALAAAKNRAEQTGITYPWVLDPDGDFFYEADGQGMPTTLLLSDTGTVIDTKTGAFDNAGELQAFLDQAD